MTLVFSGLGHILSAQFGVNEIASSIAVGKAVGTLFTRQSDAAIFKPLAQQYGIRVRKIAPWMRNVSFERSGTILGDSQRQIRVDNTMAGVQLDSIEGIATFIILIIRYVEGSADTALYIRNLLKGDYHIVCGGDLETDTNTPKDSSTTPPQFPFSLNGILRTFVNSVLDADADSRQHRLCLLWMSQLAKLVGSSAFMKSSTVYSREEHQKLLRQLLGQKSYIQNRPVNRFDTLSAGSAMIALAARANGADVQIECRTPNGVIHLPTDSQTSRHPEFFTVVLWLTEPPEEITKLGQWGQSSQTHDLRKSDTKPGMIPVYGGASEISSVIAGQIRCNLEPNISLALWKKGVAAGEAANWKVVNGHDGLRFRIEEGSIVTSAPAQVAQLADKIYPQGDWRYPISRRAADIYHDVFNYADYKFLDPEEFKRCLNFIWISFVVGSLKALISNKSDRLLQFAWTIDCSSMENTMSLEHMIEFVGGMIGTGVLVEQILWQAACIWGGSTARAHNNMIVHDRVLGIVCPHMVILLNVIRNPTELAVFGISKGIMSVHVGSAPTLPRDPKSNMVIAGNPRADVPPRNLVWDQKRKLPKETEDGILLSMEPFHQPDGTMTSIICAWQYGEVVLEMDPSKVFHNLFARRGLQASRSSLQKPPNARGILPLRLAELLDLEEFTIGFSGVAVVDASNKPEWQVVAAGTVYANEAIFTTEGDTLHGEDDSLGLPRGKLVVITTSSALQNSYQEKVEEFSKTSSQLREGEGCYLWFDQKQQLYQVHLSTLQSLERAG